MDAAVVVDASVWASVLMPRDVNHSASRVWLRRYIIEGGIMVVPPFVLIEVAAAIARQSGQPELGRDAVRKLYQVHSVRFRSPDTPLFWSEIEVAVDLQLRAGDAIYVALAHQLHLPLVTWDREQLTRARSLTTTYTPDTYIF